MRINPLKFRATLYALMFLFFIVNPPIVNAQTKLSLIKGVVTDNDGNSLPGVSVIVKNSRTNFTAGTSTDSSGIFTFDRVTPGGPYSFTFSNVGYETQPLSGYNIKEDVTLSVVVKMRPTMANLDQVVVVGYGTQRRKDVTGSVASVGNKDIKDLAVTRLDQALMGKIAGVQVKPVSGEPGAAPQVRVRGIGSISAGSTPLYVVDGFPMSSIETINPNDIESIDVLKDASASAIYGSRGSNGVIIVNTKKGRSGKAVISFDSYYGWQEVSRRPKFINAMQLAQYFTTALRTGILMQETMFQERQMRGGCRCHPLYWMCCQEKIQQTWIK